MTTVCVIMLIVMLNPSLLHAELDPGFLSSLSPEYFQRIIETLVIDCSGPAEGLSPPWAGEQSLLLSRLQSLRLIGSLVTMDQASVYHSNGHSGLDLLSRISGAALSLGKSLLSGSNKSPRLDGVICILGSVCHIMTAGFDASTATWHPNSSKLGLHTIDNEILAWNMAERVLPTVCFLTERATILGMIQIKEAGSLVSEAYSAVRLSSARGQLRGSPEMSKKHADEISKSNSQIKGAVHQLARICRLGLLSMATLVSVPWPSSSRSDLLLSSMDQPSSSVEDCSISGSCHSAYYLLESLRKDDGVIRTLKAVSKGLQRLSEADVGQSSEEISAGVRSHIECVCSNVCIICALLY